MTQEHLFKKNKGKMEKIKKQKTTPVISIAIFYLEYWDIGVVRGIVDPFTRDSHSKHVGRKELATKY